MPKDKQTIPSSAVQSIQDETHDSQRSDIASIASAGMRPAPASSSEVAHYVSDMLESLENLAQRHNLSVLGLMLAMARDQADDDAGKLEADRAHATR